MRLRLPIVKWDIPLSRKFPNQRLNNYFQKCFMDTVKQTHLLSEKLGGLKKLRLYKQSPSEQMEQTITALIIKKNWLNKDIGSMFNESNLKKG